MSRMTVTRLLCLGIASSFCDAEIYERAANSKNDTRSNRCASDLGSAPERIRPKHPAVPVVEDAALVGDVEHDAIGAQVERANLLRRGWLVVVDVCRELDGSLEKPHVEGQALADLLVL